MGIQLSVKFQNVWNILKFLLLFVVSMATETILEITRLKQSSVLHN